MVVLDASMALAWLFERQVAADGERADRLLEVCGEAPWWVPGLWHLEIANALVVAERRALLPPADSDVFLARIGTLPIHTDSALQQDRGHRILALARHHRLTSYEATYLELCQRLGATLASFDRALNRAAEAMGIGCFDA